MTPAKTIPRLPPAPQLSPPPQGVEEPQDGAGDYLDEYNDDDGSNSWDERALSDDDDSDNSWDEALGGARRQRGRRQPAPAPAPPPPPEGEGPPPPEGEGPPPPEAEGRAAMEPGSAGRRAPPPLGTDDGGQCLPELPDFLQLNGPQELNVA